MCGVPGSQDGLLILNLSHKELSGSLLAGSGLMLSQEWAG